MVIRSVWGACGVVAAIVPGVFADEPLFTGLGDLPGGIVQSFANGVSADGLTVVGTSASSNGLNEAFVWTDDDGLLGLGDLPGGVFWSEGAGVSADGSVVAGTGAVDGPCPPWGCLHLRAIVWTAADGFTILGEPAAISAGISGDGLVVVGRVDIDPGAAAAFRKDSDGPMTALGILPGGTFSDAYGVSRDGLVVVGKSHSGDGPQAFLWTEATGMVGLGDLQPAPYFSEARAANADGSVIVGMGALVSFEEHEAFFWTEEDGMVGLGDLPGGLFRSAARAVSDDGTVIVGVGASDEGDRRAFIWTASSGMRDLADVLQTDLGLDITGWTLEVATGVSADGRTIVGSGVNPFGKKEAWLAYLGPAHCPADLDGDGVVGLGDLPTFVANLGVAAGALPEDGDLDGDGDVDLADFALFAAGFGACQ